MDLYCKINVNLNDEETRLLFSDFFRRLSAFYSRTEGSSFKHKNAVATVAKDP